METVPREFSQPPNISANPLHEAIQSNQGIPAREIFATPNDIERVSQEAIDSGTIQVDFIEGESEAQSDISPYIRVDESDVDVDKLPEKDKKWATGRFEEIPFKDEAAMLQKTKKEMEDRLLQSVFAENRWHLDEPLLQEDLQNGTVTEIFDITSGEDSMKLVNFTDVHLTQDQMDKMEDVIKKIAALSGGSLFKATNAICFLPSERFKGNVVGTARGATGVVVLNEKLIDGSLDNEKLKFSDLGLSMFESTLTHELGHLIELQDTKQGMYAKGTGWNINSGTTFVDDYGNIEMSNRAKLETPLVISVNMEDGTIEEMPAQRLYGQDEIDAAKPVTEYGYTNEREDFAEAFVPFVHTGRDDRAALDRLRRDAITGVLQRGAEGYGPFNITIERTDITTDKIGFTVKPRTYVIKEPIYSFSASAEEYVPPKPTPDNTYSGSMNTFIDDYGNEQTVYGGHKPKKY